MNNKCGGDHPLGWNMLLYVCKGPLYQLPMSVVIESLTLVVPKCSMENLKVVLLTSKRWTTGRTYIPSTKISPPLFYQRDSEYHEM